MSQEMIRETAYPTVYPIVGIIPSLNPDENMVHTVQSLLEAGFTNVIVVDDGSRRDCQSFFKEVEAPGVTVLHHKKNKGKGAALKTAFRYYLDHFDKSKYYGVITADADGQHLTEDIKRTAEELRHRVANAKRKNFLIFGSRQFHYDHVPDKSRFGNNITTFLFKLLYGKHISDTQTGLRGISNAYLEHCVHLSGDHFEYEMKMLIDAVCRKMQIIEVPIQTVYHNFNRETHFQPVKDSFEIYGVMFQCRFGRSR